MTRRIRPGRRDPNEAEIVQALERCGWTVQPLDCPLAQGVPDLLCGKQGINLLLEVKSPPGPKGGTSRGFSQRLRPEQEQWHEWWRGRPVCVVTSIEEALAVVAEAERGQGTQKETQG
jgi:hypothetical protein